jgi:ABC-type transporter Mla subunit MlaD
VNGAIEEYTRLAAGMNDPDGQLQQLVANANGLLEDIRRGPGLPAKVLNDPALVKDVEALMAELQVLMTRVNAMAADLQDVTAKLPAMADTVGGEVDNLPVVVGETQTLMRETTVLLEGLQKHWFLRKYVETDDALRAGRCCSDGAEVEGWGQGQGWRTEVRGQGTGVRSRDRRGVRRTVGQAGDRVSGKGDGVRRQDRDRVLGDRSHGQETGDRRQETDSDVGAA